MFHSIVVPGEFSSSKYCLFFKGRRRRTKGGRRIWFWQHGQTDGQLDHSVCHVLTSDWMMVRKERGRKKFDKKWEKCQSSYFPPSSPFLEMIASTFLLFQSLFFFIIVVDFDRSRSTVMTVRLESFLLFSFHSSISFFPCFFNIISDTFSSDHHDHHHHHKLFSPCWFCLNTYFKTMSLSFKECRGKRISFLTRDRGERESGSREGR